MSGDWIKVLNVTPDKPEIYAMAERLDLEPEHVFGCTVIVWIWADQQTIDGNAGTVTKKLVDRKTNVTGFADAMISVGWMHEENGNLSLPNFDRHNGQTAKNRATTALRVAAHKKRKSNGENVTKALPREEKRRDKKINKKTSLPPDFGISERVSNWAKEKGYTNLEAHLENFTQACQSKNYTYSDWDAAFMTAIRKNWAGVESKPSSRAFPL